MNVAYLIMFVPFVAGCAIGVWQSRTGSYRGIGGWVGLGILAILSGGLVISGSTGSESAAMSFGASLMFAFLVLLLAGLGAGLGRFLGRKGKGSDAA
jgi:hypothetical protein